MFTVYIFSVKLNKTKMVIDDVSRTRKSNKLIILKNIENDCKSYDAMSKKEKKINTNT